MELRDLGGALRRQKLLVVVVLVATVGFAGVGLALRGSAGDGTDTALAWAVAAVLGLALATGAALIRDRRTRTVTHGDDLEQAVSAPLLGHLASPVDATALPTLDPTSGSAEVFRRVRVAVQAETRRRAVRRIVVAGLTSGDVNVWLGANLAVALAQHGGSVLLVDGRMGERFGRRGSDEPDTPGLADVLAGTALADAISPGPTSGLSVLPSGEVGDRSTDWLLEHRFAGVISAAEQLFDVVVVIAPALDLTDDARMLAVGGSLLLAVPEAGVSAETLRAHADRVRAVGARVLGAVLVSRRLEGSSARSSC